ncbi:MAG: UDP-N-acetylglucosamine pyrophosphorylase [Roseburia sp.]|nr:UDP-N-acetylglucosamine pyrophosphorylase [Roseburia sp.]MCM1280181.1 UDP-N-acetylglucosamine pyrophosphorylase [Robinsoniella sp.]
MRETAPENLVDLKKTIAAELFSNVEDIWEVLPKISEFIVELGNTLPEEKFEKKGENIWIAKSAKVAPSAYINGPCIIDEEAEIRHCAFIRGNAIVGKGATVGNSTELKNVVLFDKVEVPHYNYVGDSILGFKAHLGAGAITSNVKNDKTNVTVRLGDDRLETGLRKFGAMIGDFTQVGCNSVLNPGTVLGRNVSVYPLSSIRGFVKENTIYKTNGKNMEILEKEQH